MGERGRSVRVLVVCLPSQRRVLTKWGDLYRNCSGVGPAVRTLGIH